jgi:hypothetical protein
VDRRSEFLTVLAQHVRPIGLAAEIRRLATNPNRAHAERTARIAVLRAIRASIASEKLKLLIIQVAAFLTAEEAVERLPAELPPFASLREVLRLLEIGDATAAERQLAAVLAKLVASPVVSPAPPADQQQPGTARGGCFGPNCS